MVKVTKSKIKILVADDHPVVRKGLQLCLAREPRLKIVGEAADGDEALRKTHELEPDVVLMDVNMPRMDGLAVTELLRKEAPAVKVLVLSMHTNQEFIFRIIQAGAHGYVSKEASPDELLRAIESVFIGEPFFSQDVARAALNQMVNSGGRKEPYAQLTGREREVMELVTAGLLTKQIAGQLNLSEITVKLHRRHVMEKMQAGSLADLVRMAERIKNLRTAL